MLEARIRSRILRLGFDSITDYWDYFRANEITERKLIQGLMTTHYTFFFREFAHFEVLGQWLDQNIEHLKQRFKMEKKPLRVWSAAYSRGQEAYSLAMLLDLNLTQPHGVPFEILGTDICAESVNYARNGVYPIKEVNTIPQIYLAKNWRRGTGPISRFAAIQPILKKRARFEVLNLLESENSPILSTFDVIFCRNVFIYFSDENIRKLALTMTRRLEDGGLFVSGMSEPLRFPGWDLQPAGPSCYMKSAPKAVCPIQAAPTPVVVPVSMKPAAKKYRALCVDDSATIQTLMKRILGQDPNCLGVDTAANGREAREKLDKNHYDLVTLDIHMPEINGIEFLERLYNKESDPPVLMVSSVNRTDLDLATKSLKLGAFDYVEKPALNTLEKSTEEILTKIRLALNSGSASTTVGEGIFDSSMGEKMIIPNASLCLRVIVGSPETLVKLDQVLTGQSQEYRSPALIVISDRPELHWAGDRFTILRHGRQALKPNHLYISTMDVAKEALVASRPALISLQVLHPTKGLASLKQTASIQVLLDESHSDFARTLEREGLHVSDITPSTSFPSLSLEYFSSIRKAVA